MSKLILLHDHPFSGAAPREFRAASIGDWLLGHYGDVPAVTVQVFRGRAASADTEITADVPALVANDADVYTVLQSPGFEIAIPAALKTIFTYLQIAAAVYTIGSALLGGNRGMPANVNRTSASPNNSLGVRENQLRLRQRWEDIYGEVPAVPSIMAATIIKYVQNRQYEIGYYGISRGYLQILADNVIDGDTKVSEIPGASAAFYAPFTSPNSGDEPQLLIGDPIIGGVVSARQNTEVNGYTLKAENQVQLAASDTYTFTPDAGGDIIVQDNKAPNFSAVAVPGDEIVISAATATYVVAAGGTDDVELEIVAAAKTLQATGTGAPIDWAALGLTVGATVTLAGFSISGNNGARVVAAFPAADTVEFTSATGLADETVTASASATWTRSYTGTRIIETVDDGQIRLTESVWTFGSSGVAASIQLSDKDHRTPWFTLPDPDLTRAEVWVNIVALQGMGRDGGGGLAETSVSYSIEIERLNATTLAPTGTVETISSTLTGKTTDEVAETLEQVTAWVGPCRVRGYRTSPYDYAFNGTIVDEIKWVTLYGITPVEQEHFGAITTVHTVTPATARATSSRSRQLRIDGAARLLPTWSGSAWSGAFDADGRHVSGTIHPTKRIVDILHAVVIDPVIGNRPASEVDIAQIWSVQQQLDALHAEAGHFSYTFDNDAMSVEEHLEIIARVGFSRVTQQNGKLRLALDRRQDSSSRLLTHRNKVPASETLTRTFARAAEWDGVEFAYWDPGTKQIETIRLPQDGSARRPQTFEWPGFRNFPQAWLRANREYRRLLGQRMAIETACLLDARSMLPYERVDIVDNTKFKSFDGEVIGQSGLTLRLSQRVEFTPGEEHSIVLMKRDGSVQSIPCTAGADNKHVVLQSLPAEAVVTEHGPDGVRTIFSFAADSARDAMAYLIDEIDPPSGGSVKVRAINYSHDYYSADTEPIPDSAGVIN